MQISVKTNTKELTKKVGFFFKRQIPFATSKAINNIALGLREWEMAQMPAQLDRPTPFTMNGVRVKKGDKRNLTASVYLRDEVDNYLKYQINGGVRPSKRGRVLPARGAKVNAYGNVPKGKSKTLRAKESTIILPMRNGKPGGMWQKMKGGKLKPLLIFEHGALTYQKKFDWYGIGKRHIRQNYNQEFIKEFNKAIKSAR